MKHLIILLLVSSKAYSQDLCLERGHVKHGKIDIAKFAWCNPYLIDEADSSFIVYPSCNIYRYICLRCGAYVSEVGQDRKRKTIWRRKK